MTTVKFDKTTPAIFEGVIESPGSGEVHFRAESLGSAVVLTFGSTRVELDPHEDEWESETNDRIKQVYVGYSIKADDFCSPKGPDKSVVRDDEAIVPENDETVANLLGWAMKAFVAVPIEAINIEKLTTDYGFVSPWPEESEFRKIIRRIVWQIEHYPHPLPKG